MENEDMLEKLLYLHSKLVNYPQTDLHGGICANVIENIKDRIWLETVFNNLNLDSTYPVPHPDHKSNMYAYANELGVNKWIGAYGMNRKYLLFLLIRIASGEQLTPENVKWPFPKEKSQS